MRFLQNAMGAVPGPQDCFLVLRGLRTLHLRVERHGTNAAAVAAFLRERPDVAEVNYPGIGGMVSFLPAAGAIAFGGRAGDRRSPRGRALFTLAESLGGVESLIEVPAAMTHMSVAGSRARDRSGARPPVGRHRRRSTTSSPTCARPSIRPEVVLA